MFDRWVPAMKQETWCLLGVVAAGNILPVHSIQRAILHRRTYFQCVDFYQSITGLVHKMFQLLGRNRSQYIRYLLRSVSVRPNQIRTDESCWPLDTRPGHGRRAKLTDQESECSALHYYVQLEPQLLFPSCPFPCHRVQRYPRSFATLRCPNSASQVASLHLFCRFCLVHRMLQILKARRREDLEQAGSLDMVQRTGDHQYIWNSVISDGRDSCYSTLGMRSIRSSRIDRSRGIEHSTIRSRGQ